MASGPILVPLPPIETLLKQYSNVELEARFGHFKASGEFDPGVPQSVFNRLKTSLSQAFHVKPVLENSVDEIGDNVRKTTRDNQVTWIRKQRIPNGRFDDWNYGVRVSMQTEEPIAPVLDFRSSQKREKRRLSYFLRRQNSLVNSVRIDLTEVITITGIKEPQTTFEVEVELLDSSQLRSFNGLVIQVLKQIQNTTELYTYGEKEDLLEELNQLLGGRPRNPREVLDDNVLVQARNLNMRDLVWGGIIGSQLPVNANNTVLYRPREEHSRLPIPYVVTHKADGLRKLLYFSSIGIWLVMAPSDVTLVLRTGPGDLRTLTGTVLDTEYVPPNVGTDVTKHKRKFGAPTAQYWLLAFDCLSDRGNTNIQLKPLTERLRICCALEKVLQTKLIHLTTKSVRLLDFSDLYRFTYSAVDSGCLPHLLHSNPDVMQRLEGALEDSRNKDRSEYFFTVMREMFHEQGTLPYQQDGFIFTPATVPYLVGAEEFVRGWQYHASDKFPLDKRVLTQLPDVCKWKPVDQLTIDFQIQHENGKFVLSTRDRDQLCPFIGSQMFPFNGNIDIENEKLRNVPDGTIVEFKYEHEMLVPERVRTDKVKPNRFPIAIANWDWIMNPVLSATLQGETYDLVFKYHNRIKRQLFLAVGGERQQERPEQTKPCEIRGIIQPENIQGPTLIDLGSGFGGDVSKWTNFSKILAVEPDADKIPELQRRILHESASHRVRVLNAGAEDTTAIVSAMNEYLSGPADVISMMLSMSFLWLSRELMERLMETLRQCLKPGGKFIFFTIDGTTVEEAFNPAFHGMRRDQINLGPATFTLVTNGLRVQIPGKSVIDQVEGLVKIADIQANLPDFKLEDIHTATKEYFLTFEESRYTQMYTYGVFSRQSQVPVISQPSVLIPPPPPVISQPLVSIPPPPVISQPKIPNLPAPVISQPKIPNLPAPVISQVKIPNLPAPIKPIPPIAALSPLKPPVLSIPGPISATILSNIPAPPGTVMTRKGVPKKVERMELLMMPVIPIRMDLPAQGDGTIQLLTVPWYQNVYRIAAIGDGSCFFHAFLKAFNTQYQENNTYGFRTDYVANLRRDLAYNLQLPDSRNITASVEDIERRKRLGYLGPNMNPEIPQLLNYETAAGGEFVNHFEQQREGFTLRDPTGTAISFYLPDLQAFFNSKRYVGDETWGYVSQIFAITIFILHGFCDNLDYYADTSHLNPERPIVVIVGNGLHYETIGLGTVQGLKTVFAPGEEFIQAIEKKKQSQIEEGRKTPRE